MNSVVVLLVWAPMVVPRLLASCPPTFPRLGTGLTLSIQGASWLQSGAYLFVLVSCLILFSSVVVVLSCLSGLVNPLPMFVMVPVWVVLAPFPPLVLTWVRMRLLP